MANLTFQYLEVGSTELGGILKINSYPVAVKMKTNATAPPSATDDKSMGYSVGSLWVDTTNHKAYVCEANTVSSTNWLELQTGSATAIWSLDDTTYSNVTELDYDSGTTKALRMFAGKNILLDSSNNMRNVYAFGENIYKNTTTNLEGNELFLFGKNLSFNTSREPEYSFVSAFDLSITGTGYFNYNTILGSGLTFGNQVQNNNILAKDLTITSSCNSNNILVKASTGSATLSSVQSVNSLFAIGGASVSVNAFFQYTNMMLATNSYDISFTGNYHSYSNVFLTKQAISMSIEEVVLSNISYNIESSVITGYTKDFGNKISETNLFINGGLYFNSSLVASYRGLNFCNIVGSKIKIDSNSDSMKYNFIGYEFLYSGTSQYTMTNVLANYSKVTNSSSGLTTLLGFSANAKNASSKVWATKGNYASLLESDRGRKQNEMISGYLRQTTSGVGDIVFAYGTSNGSTADINLENNSVAFITGKLIVIDLTSSSNSLVGTYEIKAKVRMDNSGTMNILDQSTTAINTGGSDDFTGSLSTASQLFYVSSNKLRFQVRSTNTASVTITLWDLELSMQYVGTDGSSNNIIYD